MAAVLRSPPLPRHPCRSFPSRGEGRSADKPSPLDSDFLGPVFLSFQMAIFYQLTPPTAAASS
jgi:hypothetical protein